MTSLKIKVPVLLGPTASGKTAFALQIAQEMKWEILSCDSRQIYQHMDIGTAKPTLVELESVPHRLINIIKPSQIYSAFRFATEALEIIREAALRNTTVFIVGGTGLYFQSLCNGFGPQVESDPEIRDQLMKKGEALGSELLHKELISLDPESAARIHSNDLQRIVRALAVFYQTGTSLYQLRNIKNKPEDIDFVVFKMDDQRETLYEKIDKRVLKMVKDGLYEEFLSLVSSGYSEISPGMQCVGYKELFPFFRNEYSLQNAVELIQRNSRRYAKRQITWFNHQVEGIPINAKTGREVVREWFSG
jgi:tRNA dimethylallyltransferase